MKALRSGFNSVKKVTRIYLLQVLIFILVASWLVISAFVFWVEVHADGASITTYGKALWWGIVTLLTVGYGDYVPVTTTGRFLASVLMCEGVLSVAILTSKISSFFFQQILQEGRGTVKSSQLNGHFLICGWKDEMHELLSHILDFSGSMTSADLVLIANVAASQFEALKQIEKLKDIQFIQGNYFEAANLSRAAPERAKKVLILADRTPHSNGAIPSMTEVDSRTIITAMTLSNIARGTLVAAEILDPKMDQYLKMASVSEIIYSREYSRLLLGNAAGGTGVANIIFDLLDPRNPTSIATLGIPDECHGFSYGQYKEFLERTNSSCVVIGILENTGNSHRIKELALREAQKTPDVAKLVRNLKSVKQLRCNHPIFQPSEDYIIPLGSMAIVVETKIKMNSNMESRNGQISQVA